MTRKNAKGVAKFGGALFLAAILVMPYALEILSASIPGTPDPQSDKWWWIVIPLEVCLFGGLFMLLTGIGVLASKKWRKAREHLHG